jgi:dTDP-4-dehydrorhamnose reductase
VSGGTLLLLGAAGQVGREVAALPPPAGLRVVAVTRAELDLTDRSAVAALVAACEPAVIVNAAAYTAVDRAESEPELARTVNADAPGWIADAAAAAGAALIHMSTDYVFDGNAAEPYREDHPASPLGVYGRTKAEGERRIREATDAHVILRTAWVFGARGQNFARTMIRLARSRPLVKVVADQQGTPTSAAMLAAAIMAIAARIAAHNPAYGTFHLTNAGSTSWHGFAARIFAGMAGRGLAVPELRPIPTAEYPTLAIRPAYSVLDCGKIARVYGISPEPWTVALDGMLPSLLAAEAAG